MTAFEIVNLVIAATNAAATIIVAVGIWDGIRAMNRATDKHRQQRETDKRRHEESMAKLKAPTVGLERQTAALETAVERTATASEPDARP